MKFDELQRKMQLAKSANQHVSYSSRSAEDILDKFKSLNSGWSLVTPDEIIHVGDNDYFKATAIAEKDGETHLASHMQPLSEPPLSKQGKPTMSLPQWFGAVSSYARKYALQGLFAMGESDFDQMDKALTQPGTPAPQNGSTYTKQELSDLIAKKHMTRDQANAYAKAHGIK